MWRLFNRIFGWDYVQYTDTATTFVARVKTCPNGKQRMECDWTRNHYNDFLKEDGSFEGRNGSWKALTF